MVGPDYTEGRSALAGAIGLGRLSRAASASDEPRRAESKTQRWKKLARLYGLRSNAAALISPTVITREAT